MLKVNSPVVASIENLPASAPPLIENVSVWAGRSASVAVTVSTAVVFSATLAVVGELIIGSWSLTGVIVIETVAVSLWPRASKTR